MTRNFQIAAQLLALLGQIMMDPSARLFGWSEELVQWLHGMLAFGQATLGILAHRFNRDGTRSE